MLKPGKTFFLSLNTDLLIQARDRFRKYGVEAGLVNKDYFQIDRNVVCCTVQTLYRAIRTYEAYEYPEESLDEEVKYLLEETDVEDKLKLYETYRKADLVIMDECQHVPARTVWYTSMSNPNALRLALSATPWRDDGRDLDIYACYGDMVPRRILSSELIEKGYLVPVKIYFAHYFPKYAKDFEGKRGGPWLFNKVKKAVFQDPIRNQLIARIAYKAPKPFMILVKEIKHGELIEKECKKLGLKVAFLYGQVDPDIRALMFDLVRREKIDGIIATTLADEGLDLPALRTLILAGGGKSSTRALQRVGRITRPWPNKKYGIVIDVWDHIKYFEDHAMRRRKIYSTEPKWQIKDILLK
ncbi:MAG: helicase-related protein [archaeon GB-1867-005]|nr:helicase-related protein [Candidatus Culexmicrobium cathedralense]